ncbi:MAG: TatD family hydrolase [Muribaculaceae bacterium]|nr:TatD family hydrolase [Muribaculaceae bacterium]
MIDTHTHPYLSQFEDGGAEAVQNAIDNGVTHIVLPNVDASTVEPMMALHRRFPAATSVAMGLHPTEVGPDWERVVDEMEQLLDKGGFVAVGEIGIDLYWEKEHRIEQMQAFARQLRIASRLGLPVIIHCREALDETLQVISEVRPDVPLIFHSFTGSPDDVRRIREVCDPFFGINGVVTFKNAKEIREALPLIGLDKIVVETDAPYLAPVPFRGRRNEPAYVVHTCAKIAEVLGLTPQQVEASTDINAKRIFRI